MTVRLEKAPGLLAHSLCFLPHVSKSQNHVTLFILNYALVSKETNFSLYFCA